MVAWAAQKEAAIAKVREGLGAAAERALSVTVDDVLEAPSLSKKAIWFQFPSWAQVTVCVQYADPWQVIRVLEPLKAAQRGLLPWLEAAKRHREMCEEGYA